MKQLQSLLILMSLLTLNQVCAQTLISGRVTDAKQNPIAGANVYLEGAYDGGTSDASGTFSFKTTETGAQILIVSFISFETYRKAGDVSNFQDVEIKLREDVNALDAVVLSAGTFSAGDNSKVNALSSLDVVTTASALGDFVGALQTLPGTTTVAEDGRLFVRGGEANETQIFIDGTRVFTPYTPTANNVPTRGRYSPFLFDGITFSTGGYSAEYGQALSSVLMLNTIDEPEQNKTDIGLMSVGGALGHTKKWEKSALSVNASYMNLGPYISLFPGRNDWEKPYQSFSGEAVFRKKMNKGLFKLYTAYELSDFELTQEHIDYEDGVDYKLNNKNLYVNTSYQGKLNANWSVFAGGSYTNNKSEIHIESDEVDNLEHAMHAKVALKYRFNNRYKLNFGAEQLFSNFDESFKAFNTNSESYGFDNSISASFVEADMIFTKKLALKAGLRGEYSALFKTFDVTPRISLAYKVASKSQVSLAYGSFYQNPNNDILNFNQVIDSEESTHYLLNYQLNGDGRLFRAEAYFKDYRNLIKYDTEYASYNSVFTNNGSGYAKGFDLFFRDDKTLRNFDYWVSYSYLDTERDYQNYPIASQPNFANTHNFSVVGKYWVDDWKSQIGFSYSLASGRTYTNPNETGFLNNKTKAYNNLSLNWAYLISPQKILYLSVNNVLDFKNVNGYQYASTPNSNGVYNSRALTPASDQFFFVGFFWTISDNGTDNQLDNL
ncbi:TonB-dependent receptor [Formosa agariphila KMM 3901]|uniref:TonB-dependent receptor n=1 Tax=Formosa agariphila (strain DSM 15362 / KCTC 12365 / LMG 23005 / KMM 3901 / M-2Alg 35-1) TaxID=1347342 RepID=T2KMR3_FORAG|nr:TonB-dependent receptor [Formosa agariphila]CDF79721.1 TonB-dependent receptor [Formosa agariphila KMM 3901]